MKALVKAYDKPGLWLEDVAKPDCGPEDVLIKITEVAICRKERRIDLNRFMIMLGSFGKIF